MRKLAFLTVLALFVTSCHNDDTPVAPENPASDLISPAMYMGIFTRDGNKPFTGVLSVAPCNESTSIYYGNYVNQKLTPFHGYYFIKDGSVYPNANNQEVSLPAGTYEWTVQAIDGSGFGGAFAAKQTFTIGASGVESVSGYNPAVFVNDNTLSIVGMQGEAQTVNVYSISGALLNTAAFNDNIDLQLPQAGIYMVEVQAADGGQYITKVVVK